MNRVYEVDLLVAGAITCKDISFNTDKELNLGDIFNSNITIKPHSQGVKISSTVNTESKDRAYKVAVIFIGRMLDVLSVRTDTALFVANKYTSVGTIHEQVKVVIEKEEFDFCFEQSRFLNLNHAPLLRSLNWYRKGLYTDDPIDKFFALWNSIVVVSQNYYNRNHERAAEGIVNQIYDCFITLWGEDQKTWEYINGERRWIDRSNVIRNDISHGLITIEIDYVQDLISKLDNIQKVAYKFITDWSRTQKNINLIAEILTRY